MSLEGFYFLILGVLGFGFAREKDDGWITVVYDTKTMLENSESTEFAVLFLWILDCWVYKQ